MDCKSNLCRIKVFKKRIQSKKSFETSWFDLMKQFRILQLCCHNARVPSYYCFRCLDISFLLLFIPKMKPPPRFCPNSGINSTSSIYRRKYQILTKGKNLLSCILHCKTGADFGVQWKGCFQSIHLLLLLVIQIQTLPMKLC